MTPKKKPLYEGKMWVILTRDGVPYMVGDRMPYLTRRHQIAEMNCGILESAIPVLVTITPIVKGKGKR
jgi:hypothetical protein